MQDNKIRDVSQGIYHVNISYNFKSICALRMCATHSNSALFSTTLGFSNPYKIRIP